MPRDLIKFQRALFLRKKKGYSYNEIREEVPVAKSTLSLWLRDVELSEEQRDRLKNKYLVQIRKKWGVNGLGEWNRARRQKEISAIRIKAKNEIGELSDRELFISGIMLYWAEGSKDGKGVRVSNSDPAFILFMMQWLRECCEIPEDHFCASVHYHQGQDEFAIKKYWSKLTNIPVSHFYKSFCKPPGTGHRKHFLQYGTMQIRLCKSADLYHRIAGWRDGLIRGVISGTKA